MNGKDLLIGLNYIDRTYIEEAELTAVQSQGKIRTLKRPLLIAAIVAMTLMLVGCAAAVYLLRSQDMAVGTVIKPREIFSNDGTEYLGTEGIPNQVLSVSGIQGTPSYLASQEWFEFLQNYDPDYEIYESVKFSLPVYPKDYDSYRAYTRKMVDKIDELAQKYDLKLVGEKIKIKRANDVWDILGIDGFLQTNSNDLAAPGNGPWVCYENNSFSANFMLKTDGTDGQWPYPMYNCMHFLRKGYFSPFFITLDQTITWNEWNYTTKSGNNVLLLFSDNDIYSWIICDRDDAIIAVQIQSQYEEHLVGKIGKAAVKWHAMTQHQLEQIADSIDFDIQPKIDISNARERNGAAKN